MYKNILIALLLCLNVSYVSASRSEEMFLIYGDSQDVKAVYDVKNDLLKEFEELVKGLDEDQYSEAIANYLAIDHANYKNHTLTIVVGDGKGPVLSGKLKANYCKIEKEDINTHFFFKKLWTSATS